MRRFGLVLLLAPLLVGCGGADTGDADEPDLSSASCVGPYLDDQPPGGTFGEPGPTVAPGDTLTIYGHFFHEGCNDAGQDEPETPLAAVRLRVTYPDGLVVRLGPFAPAGPQSGFVAPVTVPTTASVGTATVTDDREPYPATYSFEVGHATAD